MKDENLDLFNEPYELPKHQKHSATSRAAAAAIAPKFPAIQQKVYDFLLMRGDRGATDEEIQTALRMEGNTERPARVGLKDKGLVKDSNKTRLTRAGRAATVWVA